MINSKFNLKNYIQYVFLAFFYVGAFLIDTISFTLAGKTLIQLIFCSYLILLTKQRSRLLITVTIAMLSLESLVFFGQVEYALFFALLAYISIKTISALVHIQIAVPLITLNLVLVVQKLFSILYLQNPYNDFLYTIGHFGINNVILIMYWIFENNGKQGNRP